jgi:sulfide:quinone oxidoreductase
MSRIGESRPTRVLIAGGGIAGLETALALSDLGADRVEITLFAPERDFLYKPLTVEEPFTGAPAERHELEPLLADIGAAYVEAALERVEPDRHVVVLDHGRSLEYDALVVCTGGRARPAYGGDVETFWSNRSDLPVDELIERAANSESEALALVVPSGTSWSLPMYEIALQIRRRSEDLGRPDLTLRLLTPEESPLIIFGPAPSNEIAELLRARRIDFSGDSYVREGAGGALEVHPGQVSLEAGAVIALPRIVGASINGLPANEHGFLPVDEHGRVHGVVDVYAAGDGTDFPVKQGGIATQQADAVAEHLAAAAGADVRPEPFAPVLRGQLVTGVESLHMRHELTGGHGEGRASLDYLWWPPHKVSGRYLSAWLAHSPPARDLEPPGATIEVSASFPHDWHGDPLVSKPLSFGK